MIALHAAIVILLASGIAALVAGGRGRTASWIGAGGGSCGAILGLVAALRALFAPAETWSRPWSFPGASLSFRLDPLAALFLIAIFLLALACAVYGAFYLRDEGERRPLRGHWFFFNLLCAAMATVVTAANAVLFLFAWEVMSVASFFLVAFEHREAGVRRAAWLYLLATHLGTAFLFFFFLFCGKEAGSFDFTAFSALSGSSAGVTGLLFLLALLGFGTKAGVFPFHVWLPDAHPAAPSHVSALMSGAMVKTGLYGILRLTGFLPAPAWWGIVLMVLGIAGALYGICMAAMQRDIKRCLAYSTVENVGIIVLALGLSLFAGARGLSGISLFAAAAGLLHLINHALFKGLMFLGAGAVAHASGTRDLDKLGGLLRRLPVTGALLTGGSLAIAALPPLNGFAGEWLLYLALLRGGAGGGLEGLLLFSLVALLALTGGLALLVFTRLVGIALLGSPRTPEAAHAHDPGWGMNGPAALLLALCLAVGLFPALALQGILPAASILVPGADGGEAAALQAAIEPLGQWGGGLLLLLAAATVLLREIRRRRPSARGRTWGCGFPFPQPRMAYTAEGYSEMVQTHLLPGRLRPQVAGGAPRGLFPASASLHQESPDPVLKGIFDRFFSAMAERCQRLRWLQQGRLHVYLLYILLTCVVLLAWAAWPEGRPPW